MYENYKYKPSGFSLLDEIGARPKHNFTSKKISNYQGAPNFKNEVPAGKRVEYPRSLDTNDILGTTPGNFQNSDSNQPLAKMRENRSVVNLHQTQPEDSLDKFQNQRKKDNYITPNDYYSPTYGHVALKAKPNEEMLSNPKDDMNKTNNYTPRLNQTGNPHMDELYNEMMLRQKSLEKTIVDSKRLKNYNIITNEAAPANSSVFSGLPYGYAVKSLQRNLEDVNAEAIKRIKGTDSNNLFMASQRHEGQYFPKDQRYPEKNDNNQGYVAGKLNFYGETEFRYANKIQSRNPIQSNQFYGMKALKNLSDLKLY